MPHHRRRLWIRGPQPSDVGGGEPEPPAAADDEDQRSEDEEDEKVAGGPIASPAPSVRGVRRHLVVRHEAFYPRCFTSCHASPPSLGRRCAGRMYEPSISSSSTLRLSFNAPLSEHCALPASGLRRAVPVGASRVGGRDA